MERHRRKSTKRKHDTKEENSSREAKHKAEEEEEEEEEEEVKRKRKEKERKKRKAEEKPDEGKEITDIWPEKIEVTNLILAPGEEKYVSGTLLRPVSLKQLTTWGVPAEELRKLVAQTRTEGIPVPAESDKPYVYLWTCD